MNTDSKIDFLRKFAPFDELGDADLRAVANDFRPRTFERGDVIFRQGDIDREMYVVVEGKVRIFKISLAGNETSINISSSGALIGEFAAIDSQPRSASVVALERCAVLEMSGARFEQHLRTRPGLAFGMTRILTSKIRLTASYAETIAQNDAAGRLLNVLLLYNEQFGEEIEAGKRYVLNLQLSQSDLATLIGARREWINRILRDWHKRGLVDYHEGEITFLDLPTAELERDLLSEAN